MGLKEELDLGVKSTIIDQVNKLIYFPTAPLMTNMVRW